MGMFSSLAPISFSILGPIYFTLICEIPTFQGRHQLQRNMSCQLFISMFEGRENLIPKGWTIEMDPCKHTQ